MAEESTKTVLFALSSCPACRKTKELLDNASLEYICVELDTIDIESRDKLLAKVRKYNPKETFPTLVVNGGEKVVVGYNEEKIREATGI